jgi:hypothetical protein
MSLLSPNESKIYKDVSQVEKTTNLKSNIVEKRKIERPEQLPGINGSNIRKPEIIRERKPSNLPITPINQKIDFK